MQRAFFACSLSLEPLPNHCLVIGTQELHTPTPSEDLIKTENACEKQQVSQPQASWGLDISRAAAFCTKELTPKGNLHMSQSHPQALGSIGLQQKLYSSPPKTAWTAYIRVSRGSRGMPLASQYIPGQAGLHTQCFIQARQLNKTRLPTHQLKQSCLQLKPFRKQQRSLPHFCLFCFT